MCLDFEMIAILFLVWIMFPLILIAGGIFIVIKFVNNKRLK